MSKIKQLINHFIHFIYHEIILKNYIAILLFIFTSFLTVYIFFDIKILYTFYGMLIVIFNLILLLKLIIKVIFPFIKLDELYNEVIKENSIPASILLAIYILSITILIISLIKYIIFE